MKATLKSPVGPLRCFAMITSATPLFAVVGLVAVVVLLAVEEHDEVGVLLDRARLAQVGEHRPLVVALLGRAVELGERDDRQVEILGDLLQAAGDRGHFLQAALLAAAGRHQLEVVDDDEAEVRLAPLQRLGARAELEQAERRRVVDVERRRLELAARLREARPVVLRELAGADVVGVDLAARADQALRDFLPRHLEAEEGARRLQVDRDVVRDLEREGALSHRRAGGEDHEVRGLEAGGEVVEVLEAAREAR